MLLHPDIAPDSALHLFINAPVDASPVLLMTGASAATSAEPAATSSAVETNPDVASLWSRESSMLSLDGQTA